MTLVDRLLALISRPAEIAMPEPPASAGPELELLRRQNEAVMARVKVLEAQARIVRSTERDKRLGD